MDNLLTLHQFTVTTAPPEGLKLLREITVDIPAGKKIAILGPSGAGKTTLLRHMAGLGGAFSGTLKYMGQEVSSFTPRELARRRGYLPQNEQVSEAWNVEELVGLGLSMGEATLGFSLSSGQRRRVKEVLALVGLAHVAQRVFTTLSGGEKRRVLFARALCQSTSTLFLDEPTAFLDPGQGLRFMDMLSSIHREHNTSLLVVTHDLRAALEFDQVLLLREGRLAGYGPPLQTLSAYGSQTFGIDLKIHNAEAFGPQVMMKLRGRDA